MSRTSPAPIDERRRLWPRLLARRHGGVAIFFAVFVIVAFLTRVALLVQARHDVVWNPSLLAAGAVMFAGLLGRGWMRRREVRRANAGT